MPLTLIVLLVVSHVAFAGNRFALNLHAQRLGANELELGVVLGLVMAVPMFLAVPVGRWSDRAGFALPSAAGLGLAVAGSLLAAFSTSVSPLYLASVLVGSGYMAGHVAIQNAVGRHARPERVAESFSVLAVGFSLSGLTGPLLCGVLIDRFGASWAFLAMAAFPACAAALLLACLRHTSKPPQLPPAATAGDSFSLLRTATLRRVFIATALQSTGWDLFMLVMPLHGMRVGLSATAMGFVMGSFSAGTLAVRMLVPRLSRRFSAWGIVTGALAVTASGYLIYPQLSSLSLLVPAAFVMGASLGCGQPLSMTLLHRAAPAGREGEAVGIRSTIVSVTPTVLPVAFGALGSTLGVGAIFWATALLLAGGCAYTGRAPRDSR